MASNLRTDIRKYERENNTKVRGSCLAPHEMLVLPGVLFRLLKSEEVLRSGRKGGHGKRRYS